MLALLHPVAQVGTSFSVHASTVVGILAAGALYEWRARQGAREAAMLGAPVNELGAGRRLMFHLALLVLFLSLNGPVDDVSDD